mgnify:CR=1 FL=1
MYRSLRNNSIRVGAVTHSDRVARGFTLPEILLASTITAMLSVVLGGLVMAVQTAREHVNGLEDSTLQSGVAMERVRYMVSQTGVYEVDGQPTTLGLAIVKRNWTLFRLPEVLVVWSGGRDGGMAEAGVLNRLPLASELVVYAPDPAEVAHLLEFSFPGNSSIIDFNAVDFNDTIERLIVSNGAESVLLCDGLRVSQLSLWGGRPVRQQVTCGLNSSRRRPTNNLRKSPPGHRSGSIFPGLRESFPVKVVSDKSRCRWSSNSNRLRTSPPRRAVQRRFPTLIL